MWNECGTYEASNARRRRTSGLVLARVGDASPRSGECTTESARRVNSSYAAVAERCAAATVVASSDAEATRVSAATAAGDDGDGDGDADADAAAVEVTVGEATAADETARGSGDASADDDDDDAACGVYTFAAADLLLYCSGRPGFSYTPCMSKCRGAPNSLSSGRAGDGCGARADRSRADGTRDGVADAFDEPADALDEAADVGVVVACLTAAGE